MCHLEADQITKAARSSINGALSQLRQVNATPDEVRRRAAIYHQRYEVAALTPPALAKHWAACQHPAAPPGRNGTVNVALAYANQLAADEAAHPAALPTGGRPW